RRHPAGAGVTSGENAAIKCATASGNHPFRRRRRYIGPQERLAHILGYRSRDEQNIGMARRGNKPETESLEIVKGIAEGMHFELAAIERACIDLADRET